MGGAMAVRWWRDGAPLGSGQARHLGVYACVVAGALAFGILPLEVAQEFAAGTTGQARMIASPPHQAIPYRTAAYFYQGRDSLRNRIAYFGEAWSAGSRGPLAPLAITAGLVLLREAPENPPVYAREAWPASQDGFYIARILGILTNTLVILGGAALAARLLPSSAPIALVWLSVAPVTMINADFLWPKLLAIFFVTLAAGELIGTKMVLQ